MKDPQSACSSTLAHHLDSDPMGQGTLAMNQGAQFHKSGCHVLEDFRNLDPLEDLCVCSSRSSSRNYCYSMPHSSKRTSSHSVEDFGTSLLKSFQMISSEHLGNTESHRLVSGPAAATGLLSLSCLQASAPEALGAVGIDSLPPPPERRFPLGT